ncbi:MAG: hypothetical protein IJE75_02750, partial [Firmicutes bacterium]|nr:hypothetical protein [Bacillota bacterium]
MRYSRFVAAFVLTSALIITFIIPTSAAETEALICESGVAYYSAVNANASEWIDYYPTVSGGSYTFQFPSTYSSDGNDYGIESFVFLTYTDYSLIALERGYIYTFNFTIQSSALNYKDNTYFEFGVCNSGFNNAFVLSDVTYTYSTKANKTTYNVTCVVRCDENMVEPEYDPNDSNNYYFLKMNATWVSNITLVGSEMKRTKALGEEAYYEASVNAIKDLPQTEYDYILNKMPDAEGELTVMSGELLDIMSEFSPELERAKDLFTSDIARPCVYVPDIDIPILDIHVMDQGVLFLD